MLRALCQFGTAPQFNPIQKLYSAIQCQCATATIALFVFVSTSNLQFFRIFQFHSPPKKCLPQFGRVCCCCCCCNCIDDKHRSITHAHIRLSFA